MKERGKRKGGRDGGRKVRKCRQEGWRHKVQERTGVTAEGEDSNTHTHSPQIIACIKHQVQHKSEKVKTQIYVHHQKIKIKKDSKQFTKRPNVWV